MATLDYGAVLHLRVDGILDLLSDVGCNARGPVCRNINLASCKTALKTELAGYALDSVERVDVLDERDLVASCATLAGDDGAVSKEELPDAEPALAVLGHNFVLIRHPVAVPVPDGGRVVYTCCVD